MPATSEPRRVRRHSSTEHLLSLFEWAHLPSHLQDVSRPVGLIAHEMVMTLDDGPELSAGLRKLVEAKDCFVRQAVIDVREAEKEARIDSFINASTEEEK